MRCVNGHENTPDATQCTACEETLELHGVKKLIALAQGQLARLPKNGPVWFGIAAGAVLVAIVGTAGWSSWQKAQLLDRFDQAIAADSLRDADVVVAEMFQRDASEQRFVDAGDLLEVLHISREHFDLAVDYQKDGEYRQAHAQYLQVDQRDVARFDVAQARALEVQQLFETELLASVEAQLDTDPRQGFWDIENASDFLTNSDAVVGMRKRAAEAAMADAERQIRAYVDAGDYVSAAKKWNLSADALLEFAPQFEEQSDWFAQMWEAEKSDALTRVYSWKGGPAGLTRYFDRQAVQYRLSDEEITWITADALELHLYQESNQLYLYLKAMLYNPSWVMTESVVATIDGETWDLGFSADQIEQYEGTRNAWEGGWRPVTASDIDYLMAIATSDTTTIEFTGADGQSSFTLNAADKAGIQNMLLAYFALGGDPRSFW